MFYLHFLGGVNVQDAEADIWRGMSGEQCASPFGDFDVQGLYKHCKRPSRVFNLIGLPTLHTRAGVCLTLWAAIVNEPRYCI